MNVLEDFSKFWIFMIKSHLLPIYKAPKEIYGKYPQSNYIFYNSSLLFLTHSRWEAYTYSKLLYYESQWSKCFYAYMQASNMCMVQDQLTPEQKKEQEDLMRNLPSLKLKIGGKSLPMENFAVSKADRFLEQGNHLILPVLEIIYVWNLFDIFGKSDDKIIQILQLVENSLKNIEDKKETDQFYNENLGLCKLLSGKCFKLMNMLEKAEECFDKVISLKNELKKDEYLIPYAMYEKSSVKKDQNKLEEAIDILEKIENENKDYVLKSLLSIKIHSAQANLKSQNKTLNENPSENEVNCKTGTSIQLMLVNE